MAEHLVPLKKETGGCTLTVNDHKYSWDKDGSVVDVPYADAVELLKLPGFEVADEKAHDKAAEAAEHEAATQAPDEPQREAPAASPGLEARAPGGLDLPEAQEQLPERPLGVPAPSNSAKMGSDPAASDITPRPRAATRAASKPATGKAK